MLRYYKSDIGKSTYTIWKQIDVSTILPYVQDYEQDKIVGCGLFECSYYAPMIAYRDNGVEHVFVAMTDKQEKKVYYRKLPVNTKYKWSEICRLEEWMSRAYNNELRHEKQFTISLPPCHETLAFNDGVPFSVDDYPEYLKFTRHGYLYKAITDNSTDVNYERFKENPEVFAVIMKAHDYLHGLHDLTVIHQFHILEDMKNKS